MDKKRQGCVCQIDPSVAEQGLAERKEKQAMIGLPVHVSIGRNAQQPNAEARVELGWFVGSVDPYKMLLILYIRVCLDSKDFSHLTLDHFSS